jgi:hypothetical protein
MPNYGLNEVNLRHDELLRRGQQAQRDYERLPAQERRSSLAWLHPIKVFLKQFSQQINRKDTLWSAKLPSTTPKHLPSAPES